MRTYIRRLVVIVHLILSRLLSLLEAIRCMLFFCPQDLIIGQSKILPFTGNSAVPKLIPTSVNLKSIFGYGILVSQNISMTKFWKRLISYK